MFSADSPFMPQARLAVRVLRHVAEERDFALKGGTAINLFYRDLPRLSVDLDLTYLPVEDRDTSLVAIRESLARIAKATEAGISGARARQQGDHGEKLVVSEGRTVVTVEVNTVLRGSVHKARRVRARASVEDVFGDIEAHVLSFEDCFGGKLVAALDRQHPRDLFDVAQLLAAEGLTRPLLDAFVIYLASHGRPISELLSPRDKDIGTTFQNEFAGMTSEPVAVEALLEARARLVRDVRRLLLPRHVEFLRSLKALAPDWALVLHPEAKDLPGIRWKLQNLDKLRNEQPEKYRSAREALEAVLRHLPERAGK